MKKRTILIICVAVLLAAAIAVSVALKGKGKTDIPSQVTSKTEQAAQTDENGESVKGDKTTEEKETTAKNKDKNKDKKPDKNETVKATSAENPTKVTEKPPVSGTTEAIESFLAINDCEVSELFAYSGKYVEDGTNEKVKNVAALKITNKSGKDIEYMKFTVENDKKTYSFTVMTLLAGETVTVLEADRAQLKGKSKVTKTSCETIAYFNSDPTIYPETFEIYPTDGVITVRNISKKDVTGDIYVYYKNADENGFFGGITYRVKISGIPSGQTAQVPASHYSNGESRVVFVTYN